MKNEPVETVEVKTPVVSCDGGSARDHPRVYLHVDRDAGRIVCPYCSRLFVLAPENGTA